MKITIESTATITRIDGVKVRHWKGVTEEGTPCEVFVHRIAVSNDVGQEAFDRELAEQNQPDCLRPFGQVLRGPL